MKAVLILTLTLGLQGCLIVPLDPHYRDTVPSRENMDRPVQEGFPPIGTTREAVLSRLGAPDEAWGESRLIYQWRKVVGEIGVLGGRGNPITKDYVLVIEFDERGTVRACRSK